MARKGTAKGRSQQHEAFIARKYGGDVSPSSGAAVADAGDVRTPHLLIEAKMTGVARPAQSISVKLSVLEKIADEAYELGLEPMMALRMFNPDSPLADAHGFIDLACRLVKDDIVHIGESLDG